MQFKTIKIQNFLSIGNIELDFDNYSLALVKGVNNDSPVSKSNGAGKSSIFEALFWCLYGKTKRGLVGDDVVNRHVGKDCMVEVVFDDYRVVRARKHRDLENGLYLYQVLDGGEEKDLTKGTVKDTQEFLIEIIGMSDFTFSKVVYFGQGDIKPFVGLTDKEFKEVFEQALGVTFISQHLEKVKIARQSTEQTKMLAENEVDRVKFKIEQVEEKIKYLEKAKDEFLEEKKQEIKKHLVELKEIEQKIAEETKKLELYPVPPKSKIEELQEKYSVRDELEKKLQTVENKKKAKEMEYYNAKARLEKEKEQLERELKKLQTAKDLVGSACDACGRVFKEEDITTVIAKAKDNVKQIMTEFERAKNVAQEINGEVAAYDNIINEIKKSSASIEIILGELYEVKQNIEMRRLINNRISELHERAKYFGELIERVKNKANPFEGELKTADSELGNLKDKLEVAQKEIKQLEYRFAVINALVDILGNNGLKSYIFDTLTPELNKLANKYIGFLDDIEITISTMTKLKSGETRDKYSIEINNLHGAGKFEGNSGGEQQKVNLAISLAFNKIIRMLAQDINIMFLDEPFEALDDGSVESVMELLNEFAGSDIKTLFVITHNSNLQELFPEVLTVVKKGGLTTIQ